MSEVKKWGMATGIYTVVVGLIALLFIYPHVFAAFVALVFSIWIIYEIKHSLFDPKEQSDCRQNKSNCTDD